MSVKEVYADCAASAPILPCARDVLSLWSYANPNSVHIVGRESRTALEHARATIAECINAEPSEIAFTPSATAACHFALDVLKIGACSDYEHKSVYGHVYAFCRDLLELDSHAYAHMLANNETGEIFYGKVKDLSKKYTVFSDATAAVGQIPVDVQDLEVAALAAGGHKFGAFPSVGFIYVRGGVKDEDTFPGTPPVALALAMAYALEYRTEHMKDANVYLLKQTQFLAKDLLNTPGAYINTPPTSRLPNILSVRFDGVNARELLTMLDVNGVYASAGSACTADQDTPSRTLLASGLTEEQALSTIRLSFCPENTPDDFQFVADALRRAVTQLRQLSK